MSITVSLHTQTETTVTVAIHKKVYLYRDLQHITNMFRQSYNIDVISSSWSVAHKCLLITMPAEQYTILKLHLGDFSEFENDYYTYTMLATEVKCSVQ